MINGDSIREFRDANLAFAKSVADHYEPAPRKPAWWQWWKRAAYRVALAEWEARQPKVIRINRYRYAPMSLEDFASQDEEAAE